MSSAYCSSVNFDAISTISSIRTFSQFSFVFSYFDSFAMVVEPVSAHQLWLAGHSSGMFFSPSTNTSSKLIAPVC